jgi:hypothetical protein
MRFVVLLLSVCVLACDAFNDSTDCTGEARAAVLVSVSSPHDLAIDSVTATRAHERSCDGLGALDAGSRDAAGSSGDTAEYSCTEDGGGTYVVRVKSGRLTWTQKVDVKANECHTTEIKKLTFTLDPATAD